MHFEGARGAVSASGEVVEDLIAPVVGPGDRARAGGCDGPNRLRTPMTIVGVHWRPDSELAAPLKAHNCRRPLMITHVVSEVLPAVLADRLPKFGACPKDWPTP